MDRYKEYFSSPDDVRNFPLIVKNRNIWISKEVLAMFSKVFQRMFYGNFKERHQNSVVLPKKRYRDILELMSCLFYCPTQKPIDDDNVELMIQFTDEYDIDNLKHRCASFFAEKEFTDDNVERILRFADEFKTEKLNDRLASYFVDKVETCSNEAEIIKILKTLAEYRYNGVIRIAVPYVAALAKIEHILPLKLSDCLMRAIMESKSNRHDKENKRHEFDEIVSGKCSECKIGKRYKCLKCNLLACDHCDAHRPCQWYHASACSNFELLIPKDWCICGYEFDETRLNSL